VLEGPPLNISTTLTVYSLLATTTCARNNNSILSVSDLGRPSQNDIDVNGLDMALHWLLNYTAEGLPAISSIPYLFWEAPGGLGYHDWSIVAYQSLKSLIAFPIWEFSRNNFGDPRLEPLPDEFKISASLCRPYYKIIIDSRLFVAYLVLQSTVLMFCWVVIAWRLISRFDIAELSSYPMVDFAVKLVEKGISGQHGSIWDLRNEILWNAESKMVLKTLKDVKVVRRTESESISLRDVSLTQVDGVARPLGADGEGTMAVEAGDSVDLTFVEGGDGGLQGAVGHNGGEGVEEGEEGEEGRGGGEGGEGGEGEEGEGVEGGEGGEGGEGSEGVEVGSKQIARNP
jgi:uncharacterized membrane protein YgcG